MSDVLDKQSAIDAIVRDIFDIVTKHHQEDGIAWIEASESVAICERHGWTSRSLKGIYPKVREAIAPDTLEVIKGEGSGKRIVAAMLLLKKDATIEGRPKLRETLRQMFPDMKAVGMCIASAELRLGLRERKDTDDKEVQPRGLSGPQAEIQIYVAQYSKLVGRQHELEIELEDVKREIEKYKPIMRAMELMRDGIRHIKENA